MYPGAAERNDNTSVKVNTVLSLCPPRIEAFHLAGIFGCNPKCRLYAPIYDGAPAFSQRNRCEACAILLGHECMVFIAVVPMWCLCANGIQLPFRFAVTKYMNLLREKWCPGADLNHRHADFQSAALPLSYPGTSYCFGWVSRSAKRCLANITGPVQR